MVTEQKDAEKLSSNDGKVIVIAETLADADRFRMKLMHGKMSGDLQTM